MLHIYVLCMYIYVPVRSASFRKYLLHGLMKQWTLSESVSFLLLDMCMLSKKLMITCPSLS